MTEIEHGPSAKLLVSARRTALHQWLKKQVQREGATIAPSQEAGPAPLSFAQERLWFLQQMQPDSSGYHLPIPLYVHGQLAVSTLKRALEVVFQRHASLRTTIQTGVDEDVQVVHDHLPLSFTLTDLRQSDGSTSEADVEQAVQREFQRSFDLANGPLWRTTLFQLDEQKYLLMIVVHHLISDGWSNGLLLQDLGALYIALRNGQPSPLTPLSLQYTDVVRWERQQLQAGLMDNDLSYWREQLAHAPTLLQLPTDYPRPGIQTFHGATHAFHLSVSEFQQLQQFCHREGVTLVMALLAAFNVLLCRSTGQTDLLVGLPVFNRHQRETDHIIGLFVNTLVLRTSLVQTLSFRDLLRHVRKTALAAYEHQRYPFEKLVEALHPERNTSYSPLFQVMLTMRAGSETTLTWENITLSPYEMPRPSANFDLTLDAFEGAKDLHLSLHYRTDLFASTTIARIAGHFLQLLYTGIRQPDVPIRDLPLLTPPERELMLIDWNATQKVFSDLALLHQLIERQVEQTPERVAVSIDESGLTYGELNTYANQLAHLLRARGIVADTPVAICAERSLEMVIGLVAILKAGGAYIPLDPSYPPERLASMLVDSQAPILLAQKNWVATFPDYATRIIILDDLAVRTFLASSNLESTVTEANLAYIIYTSGSTGTPKGAMNTQCGIRNRLLWMQEIYQLSKQDRVLQKTPFSFDVSVWEFFWPLFTGAQMVLARPEGHRDSSYLCELIKREAITLLHFVPSMLRIFLEEPAAPACTDLRDVICSGESLSAELQQSFAQRLSARLHNLYGPTEAAIDVTFWECTEQAPGISVPIGKPIANTQMYILDAALHPVPIGVPGELMIGGFGLARGYYRRPELTAAKFIPHPFSQQPSERLYRTGDLARFRVDGTIEFLGRMDYQVKLRGFRIELEEIQAILTQHPSVEQAVVQLWEKQSDDKQLVAYIISTQTANREELVQDVQHFLRHRLPAYMVPTSFVLLNEFPLNASGKVDRRQLLTLHGQARQDRSKIVLPQTDTEQVVAAIWCEVLQITSVGREENFFELGGHSLLISRVRLKLHEKLGVDLSLVDLFRFTTVQALAEHLKHTPEVSSSTQQVTQRAELQRQMLRRKRLERKQ